MRSHHAPRTLCIAALLAVPTLSVAGAQTAPCWNFGSLGPVGEGVHTANVTLNAPGLLGDPGDSAVIYANPTSGGAAIATTTRAFLPQLNPASSQPFTVEFWAEPWFDASSGAGPCPVFNRQSAGNRTGWVWFQRAPGTGWNFAMYSGSGSSIGVDLTGGASQPFTLNHLVATWDGTTASLYHNGVLVDSAAGPYAANQANVTLAVGSYDNGDNGYLGIVDDLALYSVALTAGQVQSHYSLGSSTVRNLLGTEVINDGAELYWRNLAQESIGARYCNASVANSRGYTAAIDATGSRSVVANDVTLSASLLPLNAFGFFLVSQAQGAVPQPGGSQGVLCLGGSIGRYVLPGQILNSGSAGGFSLGLDLNLTPALANFVAVAPGQTWSFQAWYRDFAGTQPTSNFTDALSISFE